MLKMKFFAAIALIVIIAINSSKLQNSRSLIKIISFLFELGPVASDLTSDANAAFTGVTNQATNIVNAFVSGNNANAVAALKNTVPAFENVVKFLQSVLASVSGPVDGIDVPKILTTVIGLFNQAISQLKSILSTGTSAASTPVSVATGTLGNQANALFGAVAASATAVVTAFVNGPSSNAQTAFYNLARSLQNVQGFLSSILASVKTPVAGINVQVILSTAINSISKGISAVSSILSA